MTVSVTDVQEAPAFAEQDYAFELAENTDGSTSRVSLGTVTATDPEGAALSYSIEGGNASGLFEIDAASGELFYTGTGEDFEAGTTSFDLTVRASDREHTHVDTTVTVSVTDMQEDPTVDPHVSESQESVSEPDGEDFSANTSTAGRIAVDGAATGNIGSSGDQDWHAVELVAGVEYRIDLEGSETGVGTLADPLLRWLHDSGGAGIRGTRDDDGGQGDNARQEFTPTESGTYYISANGKGSGTGTYRLSVTQVSPPAQEAPAFAEPSYAFALAENSDGSTARVSLGTVSATGSRWRGAELQPGGRQRVGAVRDRRQASGELFYTGTGEDYEAGTGPFELTVRAGDGDLFTDTTVTVSVTDVQEDPAIEQVQQSVSEPDGEDFSANTSTDGRVAVGGSATGEIEDANDRDWFAVTLEAGKTYGIDLKGLPTGDGTLWNPYLHGVHDADGALLAGTTNDDGGAGRNSRVYFTAGADATYYVAAGAIEYGHAQGTYTLSVAEVPDNFPAGTGTTGTVAVGGSATGEIDYVNDRDWFAVTLEVGTIYRIDLKGSWTGDGTLPDPYLCGVHDADGNLLAGTTNDDGGLGLNSRVYFTAGADATYYVAAGAAGYYCGTYTLSVTEVPDDFPAGTGTTGTVAVGGSATGKIETEGDEDWFAVTLEAGKAYRIDLKGSPTGDGTLLYPYLRGVHDADGNLLAGTTNDDGGVGYNSRVYFTAGADATYYVAAGDFGYGQGTYTLSVMEVPNDAGTGTTGTVAVGGSATGEIDYAGDQDWFAVTLEAGKTYRIDLKGLSTGDGTLPDPYLRGVHDADGNLLAGTTDDYSGVHYNSRVYFTAGADATYYVAAGAHAGAYGSNQGTYTLSVADVTDGVDDYPADTGTTGTVAVGGSTTGEIEDANDRDWFAVTLEAGKTYRIDLKGSWTGHGTLRNPLLRGVHDADGNLLAGTTDEYGGVPDNSRVTFTAGADATYYVAAGAVATRKGTYTLSVTDVTDDFEAGTGTTGTVAVGGSATGEIETGGDFDWFGVELVAGRTYVIDLEGDDTGGGTLDSTVLHGLYDADGNRISGTQTNGGGEGDNARLTYTAPESGTYYIAARGYLDQTGSYTVRVTDTTPAPQEAPGFDQQGYAFALAENADGSTARVSLGTVSAVDPEGAALSYSIAGGNGSGLFEIDAASGELFYTGAGEDFEAGTGPFELTVRASDGDLFTDTTVTVGVADVQEAPAFAEQGYAFALAENADGGTNRVSLGTVSAVDPEGAALSYSIAGGNASGLFEIDAASGELFYTGAGEDFEAGTGPFELTVRASDGELFTDTTVTVSVTDVQEAPAFGAQAYLLGLAENTDGSTNGVSLHTVSAVDPEGAALSYSLEGGNGSGLFEIDVASGELFYTGTGEDYESGTTSFDLTVRASDGELFTDTTVTVSVTDVQEVSTEEPAVEQVQESVSEPGGEDFSADTSTDGRVAVGGAATGEIGASRDRDWFAVELVAGRTYTIDLKGGDTDDGELIDPYLRGIHNADGKRISDTKDDDGGVLRNSQLTFVATESGTHYIAAGAHTTYEGTYTVEVTDNSPAEPRPPAFGAQAYLLGLAENTDGSTARVLLGTVSAVDPEGAALSYSLEGGNGSGPVRDRRGERGAVLHGHGRRLRGRHRSVRADGAGERRGPLHRHHGDGQRHRCAGGAGVRRAGLRLRAGGEHGRQRVPGVAGHGLGDRPGRCGAELPHRGRQRLGPVRDRLRQRRAVLHRHGRGLRGRYRSVRADGAGERRGFILRHHRDRQRRRRAGGAGGPGCGRRGDRGR